MTPYSWGCLHKKGFVCIADRQLQLPCSKPASEQHVSGPECRLGKRGACLLEERTAAAASSMTCQVESHAAQLH